jgi:integrase
LSGHSHPAAPDLAAAVRVVREAVKDKSYRGTPLGLAVGRYVRWKRSEWGASERTIRDYEATLAAFSLWFADLEPADFEPPVGTERIREFIENEWGDVSAGTRGKKLSTLRDFFKWMVVDARMLNGDPTLPIRRPKRRDPERHTFSEADQERIVRACTRSRDLIAVGLILSFGLRKGEIRNIRIRDYQDAVLTVHGKGGKTRQVPIVDPVLRLAIEQHWQGRDPDEYLLHPEHWIRNRPGHPDEGLVMLSHEPLRQLSDTAGHMWWARLLKHAGVPHLRMHAGRHTALTRIWRKTGDLELVRQLAGHRSIQTTADVYVRSNIHDLERGLRVALDGNHSDRETPQKPLEEGD